jgi:tetratricopeptide (TPR) repeat protein
MKTEGTCRAAVVDLLYRPDLAVGVDAMDIDKLQGLSDELRKLARQAFIEIGRENHPEALKLANEIEPLPVEPQKDFLLGAIRIDAGGGLRDESEVSRGIELYENHVHEFESEGMQAVSKLSFFYCLGNGYAAAAKIKRQADDHYGCFQKTKTDFHAAMQQYRNALQYASRDRTTTQTYINLGNNLDALGRCLEALECYENALSITPDCGQALGNKGLCLKYYAAISGKHWPVFLSEAHYFLDMALRSSNTPQYARGAFATAKQEIEKILGDRLLTSPFSPKYKNPGKSQVERDLLDFGLKHRLCLNACNYCSSRCNTALGDTFTLKSMRVPISVDLDDDPFLKIQNWMNQMRLAYATARYILFLATEAPYYDDFVLSRVLIVETLDYSSHGIGIEMLKIAFKSFYSILDQIASVVNEYLKLGLKGFKVSFNRVWYEEGMRKKDVARMIVDTGSFPLNALYNVHYDCEEGGPYEKLRLMRNCLIHGFVYVTEFESKPTDDKMNEEELATWTFELAQVVRNAVAYLMFFLWKATKDAADTDSMLPTITLEERQ